MLGKSVTKLPSISAFFPCLNEEKNIQPLVEQLATILPKVAKKFEIIIIDDGSTDKTPRIAQQLSSDLPYVRTITHPSNRGYGASLHSGFEAAQYDWIFFTDGDLQFDVSELQKFLPHTQKFSVIIGYRIKRAEGNLRAFNAKMFRLFIDTLFRVHVKDIDCACKLSKKNSLYDVFLDSKGAMISAEMLYRLKKKRLPFKQIPVTHYPRKFGKPTGNNPKVVIRAGVEALRLYLHMKFGFKL